MKKTDVEIKHPLPWGVHFTIAVILNIIAFALDDIVPECVGAEGTVILESDHDTEHGQVADQQQPDGTGQHHGCQPEGLLPGSDAAVSDPAFLCGGWNCRHGFSAPFLQCPIW